ncbi:hypothetical protein QTO34_015154 [Cnephaeus nilssonii]|uniref:AAA ATPase AAA+ lid domain-containing protein n=1 Tax=Cnephaeus nilssonii TaxID=3371016 RepID=A0AA40LST8_CNENI|nr:hypothetical protein QTO34_015154 [Eptesicus nilssonii]
MMLAGDVTLDNLIMAKDNFSGADIKAICTKAAASTQNRFTSLSVLDEEKRDPAIEYLNGCDLKAINLSTRTSARESLLFPSSVLRRCSCSRGKGSISMKTGSVFASGEWNR